MNNTDNLDNVNLKPEEKDLEFTNEIRKKIVNHYIKDGGMPADVKDMAMLQNALDGIDRGALGKLKIKSDEKTNNKELVALETIANIFNTIPTNKLNASRITNEVGVMKEVKDVIDVTILDGEMSSVNEKTDYEKFMAKMKNQK